MYGWVIDADYGDDAAHTDCDAFCCLKKCGADAQHADYQCKNSHSIYFDIPKTGLVALLCNGGWKNYKRPNSKLTLLVLIILFSK